MTAQIISVFGGPVPEDLLGYVARVGEASVEDVAARFLWSHRKAYAALTALVAAGTAKRRGVSVRGGSWQGHRRHLYAAVGQAGTEGR